MVRTRWLLAGLSLFLGTAAHLRDPEVTQLKKFNQMMNASFFISPLGSDIAPGEGTLAHPYQTIGHALAMAANASDVTLTLLPGRYSRLGDRGLILTGTGRRLRILGSSGSPATVDLVQFGSPFVRIEDGPDSVSITDITIENGWGTSMVIIASSTPISFSRVHLNHGYSESGAGAMHVDPRFQGDGPRFSHCSFRNNSARVFGGAMFLGSAATLEECVFEDNVAVPPKHPGTVHTGGAALYVTMGISGPAPALLNCVFRNNQGPTGAVFLESFARVSNCSFVGNAGIFGSALYLGPQASNSGEGPRVFNCTFYNNSAIFGGAAAMLSTANFSSCSFEGNSATTSGGAVFVTQYPSSQRDPPLFSDCAFADNVACVSGGALALDAGARFSGCVMEGNRVTEATYGGGALVVYPALDRLHGLASSLINCIFRGNSAIGGGGAMYLQSAIRVEGSVFESNWGAHGGAVLVHSGIGGQGPLLSGCMFRNNTASDGGGAVKLQHTAQIEGCSFEGNSVPNPSLGGGAVLVQSGICGMGPSLSNCTFLKNVATGSGGALVLESRALVMGCAFQENVAQRTDTAGGAVLVSFASSATVPLLLNCTFIRNSAPRGTGGAVALQSEAHFEGCHFENNSAGTQGFGGGGGVDVSRGASFVACRFNRNSANGSGGGLSIALTAVTLVQRCIFEANIATRAGGGVFVLANSLIVLSNSTFQNNFAKFLGGAIQLTGEAQLEGCKFASNKVGISGGAVAAGPYTNATFVGCIFANNSAPIADAVWISGGGRCQVAFFSCALCDASAAGSVACSKEMPAPTVLEDLSSAATGSIITSECAVRHVVGTSFVLSSKSATSTVHGAMCGQGRVARLYTTREPNATVIPPALTSATFTMSSSTGTSFTVTRPVKNTSTPAELTALAEHGGGESIAITQGSGHAAQVVSNLEDGNCVAGCLPDFGFLVRSSPESNPYEATQFAIEAREFGPALSLDRTVVDVIGFPFAWAKLNTLILVRLRDQLGRPVAEDIQVRVAGTTALCEAGTQARVTAAVHVCSVTFHQEGVFSLELFNGNSKIGVLQHKVTVVSLGWPIAILVLLLLLALGTSGWLLVRGWRRRRQHIADKLLENYVGLGTSAGTDLQDDYFIDKSFLIPYSAIDIRRDIAAGGAGKVSLGTWKGTSVAVKRLYTSMMDMNDEQNKAGRMAFINELALHKSLRHPNVVQLMGVCSNPLCIVLEFMERGSLFGCLQERETIDMPWTLRRRCTLDVARAMAFLHEEGILHRDLKSLNVLVNGDWRCKVADFDQSRTNDGTLTVMVGTLLWSAPEVLEGKGEYGREADVYSFGIVMFECWTREAPYHGMRSTRRFELSQHVLEGGRPVCPVAIGEPPELYCALMRRCWHQDATQRPTFQEVVHALEYEQEAAEREEPPRRGTALSTWLSIFRSADRRASRRHKDGLDTPLLPLN